MIVTGLTQIDREHEELRECMVLALRYTCSACKARRGQLCTTKGREAERMHLVRQDKGVRAHDRGIRPTADEMLDVIAVV